LQLSAPCYCGHVGLDWKGRSDGNIMVRGSSATATFGKLLFDVAALALAAYLSRYLNFGDWGLPPTYSIAVVVAVLVLLLFSNYQGSELLFRDREMLEDLNTAFILASKIFIVTVMILFLTKTSTVFSRRWMAVWYVLSVLTFWLSRFSFQVLLTNLRRHGLSSRRVAIIGSMESLPKLSERLQVLMRSGYDIQALFCIDAPESVVLQDDFMGLALPLGEMDEWLSHHQVHQIWISLSLKEEDSLREILDRIKNTVADVLYLPDLLGYQLINHSIREVAGLPAINLSSSPMDGLNTWVKFLEDRLLAAIILLLISPLMLCLAIGVKLSSPGPVLFKQRRKSWYGADFAMYKFRSMPVGVERESGAVWASKGDGRATKFGDFLRRTSLDELPQFWNVLKGDMSIVGPRPERPVFVEQFKEEIPGYMQKHLVKGGITGWAQINGWRGNTDLIKRIEYDLYYIENWSLWFDLRIILLTVFKGMLSKNSY
jgi:putative colanic acid biosynthesis UDP-glucose lipid carrier transferase